MAALSRGISRRAVLRAALSGSTAVAGMGFLDACGPQQAAPARGPAPTVVGLAPWGGWPAYAGAKWMQFIQPGIAAFEQKNPNIKVAVQATGGAASFVPGILAGSAPDVFQDWAIAAYRSANLVLNLDPYIRQDNLDYSIWSPGQMNAMRDEAGTWFLPCYVHVDTMAVNLTALDAMGLNYPEDDWTADDAAALYRAATQVKGGKRLPGVSLEFGGQSIGTGDGDTDSYVFHLFGGRMVNADGTSTGVGDPKAYRGVQWVDQLLWDGVATSGSSDLANVPFCEVGSNALVNYLKAWQSSFNWRFVAEPHFPAGQFSFEATDYYAISAATEHRDEAWILLRYLCAEADWSRFCMQYLLRTPSIVSLWSEYAQTIEAVAPMVAGRGMEYFTAAASSYGVANRVFRYAHDNAINALNTQIAAAYSQQKTVDLAMTIAAGQINALEDAGARQAGVQQGLTKTFPSSGPGIAGVSMGL